MGNTQSHTTPPRRNSRQSLQPVNPKERKNNESNDQSAATSMDESNSVSTSHHSSTIDGIPETVIDGRRYQNLNTKYIMPIDETEQDRLVLVHFIYKHIFNGNFCAPVQDLLSGSLKLQQPRRDSADSINLTVENIPPPRILDIACGSGTWLLEMATEFPNAMFYGIDMCPSYPTTVKPSNTTFLKRDVLDPEGFPFPDDYFDFIFMRQVYGCFSESDWKCIVQEIKRILKPGGYVELREIDPILCNQGQISHRVMAHYYKSMMDKHSVNVYWARHMYDYLQNVGCMTDLHKQIRSLKIELKGVVGDMARTFLRTTLESYKLLVMDIEEGSRDNYDSYVQSFIDESIKCHSFFNYHCCWGRKPLLDIYFRDSAASSQSHNTLSSSSDFFSYSVVHGLGSPVIFQDGDGQFINHSSTTIEPYSDNISPIMSIKPVNSDNEDNDENETVEDRLSDFTQFIDGYDD